MSGSTNASYASRPSRRETNDAIDSSSPGGAAGTSTSPARRSRPSDESSSLPTRASRFVGIIPVRPDGSGWRSRPRRTYVRSYSGRRPASSPASPSSSQSPMPRGLRERKLSGAASITKPSTPLRRDLPSEPGVSLDEHDLRYRRQGLETPGCCETGDPPADDDRSHAARASASHGSARARTSAASVSMNTGSSFSAGGRSRRMPSPSAIAFAR